MKFYNDLNMTIKFFQAVDEAYPSGSRDKYYPVSTDLWKRIIFGMRITPIKNMHFYDLHLQWMTRLKIKN